MSVDFDVPQVWHPEVAPQDKPETATGAATTAGPRAADQAAAGAWSLPRSLAFRFVFCYLALYNFPFPLEYVPIPGLPALFEAYGRLWDTLVIWTGKHVLQLSQPVQVLRGKTGSGDTTYDYVQILLYAALAAVATLIWTLAADKSRDHRRLHEGLWIYVRYALGTTLLGYGMAKVIKTQFPFPSPDRLMQPIGENSPMGLLWTFMGVSTPYTFFAGAMEVLGGVLLFFRRTTTLGALVVIAVMSNVVMLNLCYDVPVKQYSIHLLLMAVFLVVPDMKRLANVLVLNRPAAPANLAPPWTARWARISALALSLLFLGYLLFVDARQNLAFANQSGPGAARPPLYGTFDIEELVRNGQLRPPLLTDASRWRRLVVSYPQVLSVRWMDGTLHRYRTQYAPAKHAVALSAWEKQPGKPDSGCALTYTWPDKDHLVLRGTLLGDAVTIRLRRVEPAKLLLTSRGFHWVSEYPFNR